MMTDRQPACIIKTRNAIRLVVEEIELEGEAVVGKKVVKGPMWKCGPGPPATLRRHYAEYQTRHIKVSKRISPHGHLTPVVGQVPMTDMIHFLHVVHRYGNVELNLSAMVKVWYECSVAVQKFLIFMLHFIDK